MLVDSHAHLADERLFGDIEGIVQRAKEASIESIINIATDKQTALRGLEISKKHPFIFLSGATTPHDVEKEGEEVFPFFANLAREKKLIAIGETGLDYHYEHSCRKLQQAFLIRYFHLAKECHLPVVIHCRDAFEDLFAIADGEYCGCPLLLHCFTGTKEEAAKALDRGWKISLSGILTFKKSSYLQEVASQIPLRDLLIETDAPYLAPEGKRGNVNEPSFILQTAKKLAEIKKTSFEEIAFHTTKNAKEFFQIE